MKILFLVGRFHHLRHFESALRVLAERGHRVHLARDSDDPHGGTQFAERLASEHTTISHGWTPSGKGRWLRLAKRVQYCLDYLRFQDPAFRQAVILATRSEDRAPAFIRWYIRQPLLGSRGGLRLLTDVLRLVERAVPSSPAIERFLAKHDPDLVLITPLIGLGSLQVNQLKSAKALGLRTVMCTTSWDHLSSKAQIRILPDLVTVWNSTQRAEAVRLHHVPPDRIAVTGAQTYDHWFAWQPSTSRAAFCRAVGLPEDRPFLLYVCSALFRETGSEWDFIERWVARIRSSPDPRLRQAGLLIRPHPQRPDGWGGRRRRDLSHFGHVAVWPPSGTGWGGDGWNRAYYDSLYHSALVVGLNTSALIEAGIVGRPVYTILAPEVATSQAGTFHFHYLLEIGGGLLQAAHDFDEHLDQLARRLDASERGECPGREFIRAFVRPYGLDVPATPVFVEALERQASRPAPPPEVPAPWLRPLRPILLLGMLATECEAALEQALRHAWHQRRRRARRILRWGLRRSGKGRRRLRRALSASKPRLKRVIRKSAPRLARLVRKGTPRLGRVIRNGRTRLGRFALRVARRLAPCWHLAGRGDDMAAPVADGVTTLEIAASRAPLELAAEE